MTRLTKNDGFWIDALFIVLTLFILPKAGRVIQRLFAGSFQDNETSFLIIGVIIVSMFLLRWVAMALMGLGPKREKGESAFSLVWLLQLPTAIMGMGFLIVGIVVPLKEYGIDITEGDTRIGIMGLTILAIEASFLYWVSRRKPDEEYGMFTFVFANSVLLGHVFLWQSFYHFTLSVIAEHALKSFAYVILLIVISIFGFIAFYIGPRSMILINEKKPGQFVLRMFAVYVVTLVSVIYWAL